MSSRNSRAKKKQLLLWMEESQQTLRQANSHIRQILHQVIRLHEEALADRSSKRRAPPAAGGSAPDRRAEKRRRKADRLKEQLTRLLHTLEEDDTGEARPRPGKGG